MRDHTNQIDLADTQASAATGGSQPINLRKPNWDYIGRNRKVCSVREAVGLYFNLHHSALGKLGNATKPTKKTFYSYLKTAIHALDCPGGLPTMSGHPASGHTPAEKIVRLEDFAAWAQQLGWKNIPASLLAFPPTQQDGATAVTSETHPTELDGAGSTHHVTPWLKVLYAAIQEFFPPNAGSRLPKKMHVVRWIGDHAPEYGVSKSDNIAEAIFTIINVPTTNHRRKTRP